MQTGKNFAKLGFYCSATNTFFYFENEEEFRQIMEMLEEESKSMPAPSKYCPPCPQLFDDFDKIFQEIEAAKNQTSIQLRQYDF